ncbi:MAG: PEP-CTERM sorting domain-containing protein [Syntrophaceae bacterium]|nr:PEP-CTERM sorting domain-containing protein [Syntrophaceae bacterium]
MKSFKKRILLGIVLTLFALMGMAVISSAATITLPDPTQSYPDGTQGLFGQNYVAWAHDDFWSFSAQLIYANQKNNASTYFPVSTYGSYHIVTGTGTLGIIVQNQNGMSNGALLPNAVKETGGISEFHDVWGLGGLPVPTTTNSMAITYPTNNVAATVGEILTFINPTNADNENIPVFGLDLQNAGSVPIQFSGQVYLVDPTTGKVYVDANGVTALWAFDTIAQGTGIDTQGGAVRDSADADWPGFSQNGTYDPTAYGDAIAFAGGGHVDYLAYAPTMDLSKYPSNLIFVTDFTVIDTNNKAGNTEVFILGDVVTRVPEPSTLLLLGLGLIGLAYVGLRRNFEK